MKDAFAIVVFLICSRAFVFFAPNYLGHAINYQPANPLATPAHIVPEWYYLPFYAILRAIPDKLGGVIAMFGSILILFVLPWLDTSRVRSGTYRPIFKQFFWIFVIVCVALGYLGSKPAEGAYVFWSRILTALLLLPLPCDPAACSGCWKARSPCRRRSRMRCWPRKSRFGAG